MARKRKKKRLRKKKQRKRDNETHIEKQVRLAKSRGGRGTMVIKDKTKYDRKKDKKVLDIE